MTSFCKALLVASIAVCVIPMAHADEWRALETNGIQMTGNVSERTFRRVAENVEAYKYLLKLSIPALNVTTPMKLRVLLLKQATFEKYLQPRDIVGGVGRENLFSVDIAIDASGDALLSATQTTLNQLTHFYLRKAADFVVPVWYEDGLSELLSTVDVDGRIITMGKPPVGRWQHVQHLKWMPISEVVTVSRKALLSMPDHAVLSFAAESWLMLHFANIGDKKWLPATLKLVALADRGWSPNEALQKVFGPDLVAYERALKSYSRNSELGFARFERPPVTTSVLALESLSEAEGLTRVALMMLRGHRDNGAIEKLLTPLAADSNNLRAAAALAYLLTTSNRRTAALPLIERCKSAQDAEAALLCGRAILGPFMQGGGDESDARSAARSSRELFERAYQLDSREFEAIQANLTTYHILDDGQAKLIPMLQDALKVVPRSQALHVDLSRAFAREGRFADARSQLERAILNSVAQEERDTLMRALHDVENAEVTAESAKKTH